MGKLIGSARVSTKAQDADRQIRDLLTAGVRRDDLYTDHGVSGARAVRPALEALDAGDTLVITLDRLSEELRNKGINLRVLYLGGGNVDTGTPMDSMVFTVMAALTQTEREIKRERINDSVSKRRAGRHAPLTLFRHLDAGKTPASGTPWRCTGYCRGGTASPKAKWPGPNHGRYPDITIKQT